MSLSPPRLGLGCSRFGSLVDGVDAAAANRLVDAALAMGVTLFDTADIYGQGDSERFLGRALAGRDDVVVVTKAGQRFPIAKRLMIPAKRLLRPIVARIGATRTAVAGARAAPLPRDYSDDHLLRSLDASLMRLRRPRVDMFLLHSPPAHILTEGRAMAALAAAQAAGKAVAIGVSINDEAAAQAALDDLRIAVIQLPLSPASPGMAVWAARARASGRTVIAREILGGARGPAEIAAALAFAARQPADVALLGTRSPVRLADALAGLAAC